jgi:ssDNA-binding Zn-finger/Zn-ribbon topoisomerase 1
VVSVSDWDFCFMRRLTQEEVIDRFKAVHGDKYDYSKVVYVRMKSKVTIICPEHGEFDQNPEEHYRSGHGCPKCGKIRMAKAQSLTTEQFIEKAQKRHWVKYDYSKVDYIRATDKVIIICPKHGEFSQVAQDHLAGRGCWQCSNSKGEMLVAEILTKYGIGYKPEYWFDDLLSDKGYPLRFDFRLDNGVLIEYDGQQHYKHMENWILKEDFERLQEHDRRKIEYCERNGLTLVRFPYTMNALEIEESILKLLNEN